METPSGLRKLCAPSRHSGDSSLSPKLPSSSLTMMSACSGAAQLLMSAGTSVTLSPHLYTITCYMACTICWELSLICIHDAQEYAASTNVYLLNWLLWMDTNHHNL